MLAAPFALARGQAGRGETVLNLYIWSNYIAPETLAKFEQRYGVRVNVDLYDSNEAMLAKLQAGNAGYDVVCPSDYSLQVLIAQGLLRPLDRAALRHLVNIDPLFLDRRSTRQPVLDALLLGNHGDRLQPPPRDRAGGVVGRLWDPRYRGRVLMLDDPREAFMRR